VNKALRIDPDNGAYVDSLGWVYYKQGRLAEAEEFLKKAASLMEDPVIKEHLREVKKKIESLGKHGDKSKSN